MSSDPLAPVMSSTLGWCYAWAGRHDEALEQLERTVELEPNFPLGHYWLGNTYEQLGRYEDAVGAHQRSRRHFSRFGVHERSRTRIRACRKGARSAAILDELVQRPTGYVSPYTIASIHEALGETGSALESLEKTYEERSWWIIWLLTDPSWKRLRDEPRFQALVRKLWLPQTST